MKWVFKVSLLVFATLYQAFTFEHVWKWLAVEPHSMAYIPFSVWIAIVIVLRACALRPPTQKPDEDIADTYGWLVAVSSILVSTSQLAFAYACARFLF